MTNYEANNSGGTSTSAVSGKSWAWLSERLPGDKLTGLDRWVDNELVELESLLGHMVTERSLKRDFRNEFAPSKR